MFLLNALSSRVKNRYRNSPITTESASTIPAATRHDLVQQIESTLYPPSPSPSPSNNRRRKAIESGSIADSAASSAAVHSKGGSSSAGSTGSTGSVGNAGNSTSSFTSNNSYNYNPNSHSQNSPRMTSSRKWRRKKRAERENERLIENLNQTIEETKARLEAMNDKETFIDIRVRKYRTLLDEQSVRLCSQHLMHGNHYIRVKKSPTPDTQGEAAGGEGDVQPMNTSIHTTDLDVNMGGGADVVVSGTDIQCNHTEEEYIIDVEKEAQIKKQFQIQEENEQKLQSVLDVQRKILTEMEICRRKLIDLQKKRDEFVSKREECEDFIIASAQVDAFEQNGKADVSVSANVNVASHHGYGQGHVNYNDEFAANKDAATMEMVTLTSKQVDDDEMSSSPIQVI